MRVKVTKNDLYIFITILLLTLSHCVAFVGTTLESLIEYAGYLFLLSGIIISYYKLNTKYRKKNTSIVIFVLVLLMIPGILLQNLPIVRMLTIIFTVLAIIIVAVMSENFISNYKKFRVMAYACLTGIFISTIVSLIMGVPIIRETSEPMFGMLYFFNGGIRDKNVATMMILIIMSIYICYRESGHMRQLDKFIVVLSILVIIVANSRGAWIEFALFILMLNYEKFRMIAKSQRSIFVFLLALLVISFIVAFYNEFVMKSETFLYRYRGLVNYIAMFGKDRFHIIFGNAELAYGSGQDYATAVRSVTGWNGTIENAWLNILIKSGILGVIAYIILFIRAIVTAIKSKNYLYKTIYLAVTVSLLASSLVAIYIQTIHGLFGIYCYIIMGYYSGKIRRNNYYNMTLK